MDEIRRTCCFLMVLLTALPSVASGSQPFGRTRPAPGSALAAEPKRPRCRLDYTVRVVDAAHRLVEVDARVRFEGAPGDVELFVTDVDGHYTPGYAQFVDAVALAAPDRSPVPLTREGGNRWIPGRPLAAGEYRLSYTVRVDHVTKPSEWGLKETPLLDAGGGVLIGAALFVFPRAKDDASAERGAALRREDVEISTAWVLPKGWHVLTPWKRVTATSQRPRSIDDLLDNFVVVGSPSAYDMFETRIGGSVVTGAIRRGAWEYSNTELWRAFASSIAQAGEMFSTMPAPAYLLIINPLPGSKQSAGTSVGGGAARQSFHAMVDEKFTTADLKTLQPVGTLVHETFHWWNPTALPPAVSEDFFWWHEGVTVYYSYLLMWRAGAISEERFLQALAEGYDRGERRNASRPARNLVEASRHISSEGGADYDVVYNLGAVFAFRLDLELRSRSGGSRSLDDLMRALYARYERTRQGFTMRDLIELSSGLAGSKTDDLFARYVEGHEPYDWDALLGMVGYREILAPTGRPVLGISFDSTTTAPLLLAVQPDGAAAGHLETGDLVVAIDDTPIASQVEFSRVMATKKPGVAVNFDVKRGDSRLKVPIAPGERKERRVEPDGTGRGSALLRGL